MFTFTEGFGFPLCRLCDLPAINLFYFHGEVQLLLWTALQSQNRAKQTERGFCPPPDISHRLFTASLHVGTVYEPRGCRCQDATSAQRTQNLSQPPTVPEVPEIQRCNRVIQLHETSLIKLMSLFCGSSYFFSF